MSETEILTLHFDLNHIPHEVEFTLRAGGGRQYILTPYSTTPGKLEEHKKKNKALALMPDSRINRLTHFVEQAQLPTNRVSVRSVTFPSLDHHPLPEVALEFIHIPPKCRRGAFKYSSWPSGRMPHPFVLKHMGVKPSAVSDEDMDEVVVHAANIKTPADTAKSLVFHHPDIATINGKFVPIIEKHITEGQGFENLVEYIQQNGPGTEDCWYEKSWVTWKDPETHKEQPMPARTDLLGKNKKPILFPVNPATGKPGIPQQALRDGFVSSSQLETLVCNVLIATQADEALHGVLWSKQSGTTQVSQTHVPPSGPSLISSPVDSPSKGWTIKNKTSSYGLDLYPNHVKYDPNGKTLSFPVKNWPNRCLYAYVEYFTSDGTVIGPHEVPDRIHDSGEPLPVSDGSSSTKRPICWIPSGNQVFGIPALTNPTTLEFSWPDEAASAHVLFGGLGAAEGFKDWDGDVDLYGTVLTGFMNYGIAFFSMALGIYVIRPIKSMLTKETLTAIYKVAGALGILAVIGASIKHTTRPGKHILAYLANKMAGLMIGRLAEIPLKKIYRTQIEELMYEYWNLIHEEEALEWIPVAGRVLQLASVAADIATLASTTVECVCSPATYIIEVTRTMDLTVTVKPDPQHAKAWPLVSDHFIISVRYPGTKGKEGGTTYLQSGPMHGRDTPIAITFDGIPAGGKCEVVANIYSSNNWLAGRWDSGWIEAVPDEQDRLSVSGHIRERLVPLTPDTTYRQKQRLLYDGKLKKHLWGATYFSIDCRFTDTLDRKKPDPLRQPFDHNGNTLSSDDTQIVITVKTPRCQWELLDKGSGTTYEIVQRVTYNSNNEPSCVLEVQDTSHRIPPIPSQVADCANDGHRMCKRVNIINNNKAYQLGYTWMASGMNLPRDQDTNPGNDQMYAFQSISTLGDPEDGLIEPSRGFSQQPYLAFDQFGLTPLFTIDYTTFKDTLNAGGMVSQKLAAQFADYALPKNAQIKVITPDREWKIGTPTKPAYELRRANVSGDGAKVPIEVFSYPVPKLDNFWLDPRPRPRQSSKGPSLDLYHLRGVTFGKGRSTFDYNSNKSWGAFTVPDFDAIAVHPGGYVVGVEWRHKRESPKMHVLRLPAEAHEEDTASLAAPLSGFGQREGLMAQPVAMGITADGRILVLEQGNRRIQAFDIKANPVHCFTGAVRFELDWKFITELDDRTATTELVQTYQQNVSPWPFQGTPPDPSHQSPMMTAPIVFGDLSAVPDLDSGKLGDALKKQFMESGYLLPKDDSQISVVLTTKSEIWLMKDRDTQTTYDIRVLTDPQGEKHLLVFHAPSLMVTVRAQGHEWTICDKANALTFDITCQSGKNPSESNTTLSVRQLISTMDLREEVATNVTYLDLAVESKGYIYVLSKATGAGGHPVYYRLDIYNPDGSVLLTNAQRGINAEKLTVNQWRSLYTLNLDTLRGPGGRTEPGISTWVPSTSSSPKRA